MKRLTFILVLLALLWPSPAQAQGPIYLPVVTNMATCKPNWAFITPQATTNYCLNPSFEAAGNYVAAGGGALTRTPEFGCFGLYGLRIVTAADADGATITTATLTNAEHYVTMRVRGGALPPAWTWTIGAGIRTPRLIESIDGVWSLYGARFTAAECNGQTALLVRQQGAGAGDFYIDGVQVEALPFWTTYVDGDQPGGAWDTVEHASISVRSAESRAGGRVRDFWGDYGFFIHEAIGVDTSPRAVSTRGYALLPGGELSGVKIQSRQFTLVGQFLSDSEEELHANRQALIKALSEASYSESEMGKQPIPVVYSGARVQKRIAAYFDGLESDAFPVSYGPWQVEGDDQWRKLTRWQQTAPVRFTAPDPFFYSTIEAAALLDVQDNAIFRYIAARLRDTNQWDDLNMAADPTGGVPAAYVIAVSPITGDVFVGGDFQGWNNQAGWNYLVRYEPSTDTWYNVGPAPTFDAAVWALAFDPEGLLYIGGNFTAAGGAPGDYICSWDGANYNALGAGMDALVYALTIGHDGTLYAGGMFTTAGGGAAQKIAQWDGDAWAAVGVGLDNTVQALATGKGGEIYAGGTFTDVFGGGGGTYNRIIRWDPGAAAYSALSTGMSSSVWAIVIQVDGSLYIGGVFVTAGGATVNYVCRWNGSSFEALSGGVTGGNAVYGAAIGADDTLFIGGNFNEVGGTLTVDRIVKWTGGMWGPLDVDFGGIPTSWDFVAGRADPIARSQYDLWVALTTSGPGVYAGLVTVTNDGSYRAYPRIVFERTDSRHNAIGRLMTVKNERVGRELLIDYDILPNERFTIDLAPTVKRIASNFWHGRADALLGGDFGTWALLTGDNRVTAFVDPIPDEQNDNMAQLSDWHGVTGLDLNNTDDWRIFASIVNLGGGNFRTDLYRDGARGAPDLIAHTAVYAAAGVQPLIEDLASGVGGAITIDAAVAADVDIYVDYPAVTGWLVWAETYDSLD